MNVNKLPDVMRIEGLVFQSWESTDPKNHRVEMQYTDQANTRHSVAMPLLDALYLLNLLEKMSAEQQFDHLRRPPTSPRQ